MAHEGDMWGYGVPSIVSDPIPSLGKFDVEAECTGTALTGLAKLAELQNDGLDPLYGDSVDFVEPDLQPDIHLQTVGVSRELVSEDFGDIRSASQRTLSSADAVASFKRLLERFVQRYSVNIRRSCRHTVFVSSAELHCPNRTGALASFEHQTDVKRGAGFVLKVLGVGGGSGTVTTVRIGTTLEARDGRCYSIQVPLELLIEECCYLRNGTTKVADFVRASVVGSPPGVRQIPIAPQCPYCITSANCLKAENIIPYLLESVHPDEAIEVCFDINADHSSQAVMGLDVSQLGTKLDFTAEVRMLGSSRFRYRLPGGANYYAFGPRLHPFLYWCTVAL